MRRMTLLDADHRIAAGERVTAPAVSIDPQSVLSALSAVVLVLDAEDRVAFVNAAAEAFFETSQAMFLGSRLRAQFGFDSPIFAVVRQARTSAATVAEDGVMIDGPRVGQRFVTVAAAPFHDERISNHVILSIHERSIARKIDRQLVHRNAARSVTAMAAMLAHEVRNPLSGIRGAAQLLEQSVGEDDRALARLITEETDRIRNLVDRMEVFNDAAPAAPEAVNIHQVLEHVRLLAEAGFGRHVHFMEQYDPSLPPASGRREQLIQIFLNLVKNACEACAPRGGEVVISTGYQHGVRLTMPGRDTAFRLPLVVRIQDNGGGIPESIRSHLFDPFVTTKTNGTGLGLALAAKLVGDHGGIIEFDSEPRRTVFRVMLPIVERNAEQEP
jgi:two-component system nitrogen regulation sensor histidine kinase GlnL